MLTPEQLARLDALPDATLELSGTFDACNWRAEADHLTSAALRNGLVPMTDVRTGWLLVVPQELIDSTPSFNAYLEDLYRLAIGRVPDLDAPQPEPDEVRSLIQGFARARQPGCPYANVFGASPPGCRCANCYQDGSGQ